MSRLAWVVFVLVAICALPASAQPIEPRTETLGLPAIPIEPGAEMAIGGVGLENLTSGTLSIDLPSGSNVKQVLLYWAGRATGAGPGDDTITAGGNAVTGTLIGTGPITGNESYHTYRKDITSLNLVAPGSNTVAIADMNFSKRNGGAGILVIYDFGLVDADQGLHDGGDFAWSGYSGDLRVTVPQTFTFIESLSGRIGVLLLGVGDVGNPTRPDVVTVTTNGVNGETTNFNNVFNGAQGLGWRSLTLFIPIPTGATELTVELKSEQTPGSTGVPESIIWVAAALSVPQTNPVPVELVSFDVVLDGHQAALHWETASETNNAGFEVQHRDASLIDKASAYDVVAFVEGAGTTLEPQTYRYRMEGLKAGRHVFRLKQLDFDGTFEYSPEVEVIVEMPEAYLVHSVYPNPFNGEATLRLGVRNAQQVTAAVYDMLGRRVLELYRGTLQPGVMRALRIESSTLRSGVYVVQIQGETFGHSQTVTLIK